MEKILAKGTAIKYNGVQVGEVTLIVPDFKREHVEVNARILPEFADKIAKADSYFWVAKAEVGLSGVKNIQNLLSQSINVAPGKGKPASQFTLNAEAPLSDSVTFTLQSESRGSVSKGTPVLYREMEVGRVTSVELGQFADRVVTTISINLQYAYLVRQNSVFWNTSGLDVSIGISGADIKAGTVDSLIRGGVTFATPQDKQLAPVAEQGHSFYLYPAAEQEWKQWRTPIPKP